MHCTTMILSESKFYFTNMKTIIAATLLGILMHAFAEECKLMEAAKNFDSEKYFSIPRVYAIHSKNGPEENVCREYETTKKPDGTIVTTVSEVKKNGGQQHKTLLTCTNREKSGSKGQFSVECEIPDEIGSNKKIQVETSVLATDNKKYVVLQRCSKTESGIADDIVVLQTDKNRVEKGVEDYFDRKGWTFNLWYSRVKANCDEIKK